jgi:hypothetical protein
MIDTPQQLELEFYDRNFRYDIRTDSVVEVTDVYVRQELRGEPPYESDRPRELHWQ